MNQKNKIENFELFDSHCHLSSEPLLGDLENIILSAQETGIQNILAPAIDTKSWSTLGQLAQKHNVPVALGLHPWFSNEDFNISNLEENILTIKPVAVGEIGLDKTISIPLTTQIKIFESQIELASKLNLPVIIHCVGKFDTLLDILKNQNNISGVIHGFTRGPKLANQIIEQGLFIGMGRSILNPKSKQLLNTIKDINTNKIVLETDAPSTTGTIKKPKDLIKIARCLSKIKDEKIEDIANITTRNAKKLFNV